jgi:hypothetical protein
MSRKTRLSGDAELIQDFGKYADIRNAVDNTTAVLADDGGLVIITKGTGTTFTVPNDATVAWGEGSKITVIQGGAGAVTMTAGGGVTINKISTKTLATGAAWSRVVLSWVSANTWVASGDLA